MNWLKENWFKIGILLALVFIGLQISNIIFRDSPSPSENSSESSSYAEKDSIVTFEEAAREYPRGAYGEPAQWFVMKSLVGWERMMFIFGYADDKEVCEHLAEVASEESPDREFRCEDAN